MSPRSAIGVVAVVPLSACNSFQNALGGNGADGANFVWLMTIFGVVCAIIYLLVIGALAIALWHSRRARAPLDVESGKHDEERAIFGRALVGWGALIVVGLTALTVASFFADRSNALAARNPQLTVTITGNQWWWDIEYQWADVSKNFRTANELHLPVGVPVEITLKSNDVIHSFWIPNLAGKQDLIPGRVTDIQLLPTKVGLFRGQCAEFCGIQHAHMALDVTVESNADFKRWVAAQQRVAFAPASPLELAGYRYFTFRQCGACHNVSGTPASASIAPDLTHLASRRSIAAGTLPMSTANLQRWIADPQAQKPGNNMPKVQMAPIELRALASYLARLK